MTRGTVLIAKDGRLCVLADAYDDSLLFFSAHVETRFRAFSGMPLVDYNGVNRSRTYKHLEGNAKMIGQSKRRIISLGWFERRRIMDLLAMTFEQADGDLKPSPKFQFYAAELTKSNGRAIRATEVGDEDCQYKPSWPPEYRPYRPPQHRLLDVGDELFQLAVEQYKSFEQVYSGLPTRPKRQTIYEISLASRRLERMTRDLVPWSEESDASLSSEESDSSLPSPKKRKRTATEPSTASPDKRRGKSPPPEREVSTDCGIRKRLPLKTKQTTKLAGIAVFSAKQALLFKPSNEEDQDDEETLPASKLEDEAEPEPEPQFRTPAQREGAGVARIATTPVGDASSVVRSAEESEDMDEEDIDLEMRNVELEQRKVRLHQMRRALEKKMKKRREEG